MASGSSPTPNLTSPDPTAHLDDTMRSICILTPKVIRGLDMMVCLDVVRDFYKDFYNKGICSLLAKMLAWARRYKIPCGDTARLGCYHIAEYNSVATEEAMSDKDTTTVRDLAELVERLRAAPDGPATIKKILEEILEDLKPYEQLLEQQNLDRGQGQYEVDPRVLQAEEQSDAASEGGSVFDAHEASSLGSRTPTEEVDPNIRPNRDFYPSEEQSSAREEFLPEDPRSTKTLTRLVWKWSNSSMEYSYICRNPAGWQRQQGQQDEKSDFWTSLPGKILEALESFES